MTGSGLAIQHDRGCKTSYIAPTGQEISNIVDVDRAELSDIGKTLGLEKPDPVGQIGAAAHFRSSRPDGNLG